MKNLKTLGVLALAATALTAVLGVGSASAFTKFTASKVGATIEESTIENFVITMTGAKTECSNITYTGVTQALESTSQMLTPKYEGCTAFGLPSTVTNEGCTFNLTIGTPTGNTVHLEPVPPATTCTIKIVSKSIFGECLVEIPGPQTIGGFTYANGPAGSNDIVISINATGISDHVTKSSGVCPLTVGTHTNGTWTGKSTYKISGGSTQVS